MKFKLNERVKREVEEKAEFVKEVIEEDIYFASPVRDFTKTDEALRVRKGDGIKITYKGPKIDQTTKTREEIEITVDDFDKAVKLFEKLGFKPVAKVVKTRRIYRIDDVTICLDSVEGLGEFIEFEVKTSDVENGKKRLFELAEMFGLRLEDSIRKSYLEMLLSF